MKFITDYLVRNSHEYPTKPAIIYKGDIISWEELSRRVANWAEKLKEVFGDRQEIGGIFLPNSPEFIIAHLAILYLKGISCPIDPGYKEPELKLFIERLKPKVIVTTQERAKIIKNIRTITIEEFGVSNNNLKLKELSGNSSDIPATLLLTSGTTGTHKATLYSHNNHLWNVKILSNLWRWGEKDTLLLSLPLSHWHGLVVGLTGTIYNANTIYLQERFNTEQTLELLSSGNISLFMHVPSAYQKLVNYPFEKKFSLRKVRLFISGSSYLPPSLWEEFHSKYKVKILERYGSSEAGIISSNLYNKRIPGSVGKPLPEVKIKILGENGDEIKDRAGEIVVKSPGVFIAYYEEGKIISPNLSDGFLRTGDIGVIEDGWIFLKGRVQEKIKKSGYPIFPRDIEWVLNQYPDILDSYSLGIQKETINDEIIYFLVPKREVTEKEIFAYCRENMPKYWLPDRFFFVKEIPKTKSGKPEIQELLKIVSQP